MTRLQLFIALVCIGLAGGRAVADVRDFATQDGKVVRGELQDYSLQTDKLTIKTDGGNTLQLKAENLVDKDYIYVRDWDAVRLFSQNTHFRIYLNGPESRNKWTKYLWRRPPGQVEAYPTIRIDHNRMGYEIKIDNQTGYDLENVDIKYNIFYMQERMDYRVEEKVPDIIVRPSIHSFPIVPNGQNKKFPSNSIVLRRKEVADASTRLRYLEGEGRFLKYEMIGMIFRATIKTRSGQSTVREIRMPKDLSEEYVWVEPTAENTVWPDDGLDEREDTKRPPTFWEEMGGGGDEEE